MYEKILVGAVGGTCYSLSGWAKNAKKDGDTIDFKKMGITTAIGLVWGIIAGVSGMEIGVVATGAIGTTVAALVQNVFKAIFN